MKCFADLPESALLAAVDASVESLKQHLLRFHRQVNTVSQAKLKLEETLENGPEKYSIRKMATGSIDDFHKGLSDRIGVAARVLLTDVIRLLTSDTSKLPQVCPVLTSLTPCAWST